MEQEINKLNVTELEPGSSWQLGGQSKLDNKKLRQTKYVTNKIT